MESLPEPLWRARAESHARRVDEWVQPHLERRRLGQAHPVEDFLFTYYSHRPAQLGRWHPGDGTVLEGGRATELGRGYVDVPDGARLDVDAMLERRRPALGWIRSLLATTASRPAQLGCFGLHAWAMVYKQPAEEIRHSGYPLRLGESGTAAAVEALGLRCSHADAFRFFTEPARPLNVTVVTRDRQLELEQPGCLHAGMDLYKWAYKLTPLVAAELVADCFALARQIRLLDMAASPYDLTALDVVAVQIETAQGRSEYVEHQRHFAERSAVLRRRLLEVCDRWLA